MYNRHIKSFLMDLLSPMMFIFSQINLHCKTVMKFSSLLSNICIKTTRHLSKISNILILTNLHIYDSFCIGTKNLTYVSQMTSNNINHIYNLKPKMFFPDGRVDFILYFIQKSFTTMSLENGHGRN